MGAHVTLLLTLHLYRRIANKITIPGLSLLPFSDGYDGARIKQLDLEANPTVLVNTFEALEAESLRAVDKINMIPIGPLIPSAFLDGKDPDETAFGGNIFPVSIDYVEWLHSKEEKSVVYVSFGSYFELSKRQTEEIARALLDCGRSFLWVIREQEKEPGCLSHIIVIFVDTNSQRHVHSAWCKDQDFPKRGKIATLTTRVAFSLASMVSDGSCNPGSPWSVVRVEPPHDIAAATSHIPRTIPSAQTAAEPQGAMPLDRLFVEVED
ncbi:Crocetin glucosyltransferase [Spatholobus suberectus]|nr:Crocetin glucosyltransferase [Spatholobus suberectus]